MRVLVTGSNGFIGRHLMVAYSKDHEVRGFDIWDGSDVKNSQQVDEAVQWADLILHQACSHLVASREDPAEDAHVNTIGTLNILEACRRFPGKRLVIASTGSVFGRDGIPGTPYGVSKRTAEIYAALYSRDYGIDVAVTRYYSVYGPGMYTEKRGVIGIWLMACAQHSPLIVEGGNQIKSFLFINDLVEAVQLVVEAGTFDGTCYDIGTDEPTTMEQLAVSISQEYGDGRAEIVFADPRLGDDMRRKADTRKVRGLGWKPAIGLDDGIERTWQWLRSLR